MKKSPRRRRPRNTNSTEGEKQKPFFSNNADATVQAKEENGFFQPKLEVSPANDPQEKEADAVADQVVKGAKADQSAGGDKGSKVSMKEEEEAAAKLQRMEEEEPAAKLQRMEEEEPAAKLQRMEEEEPAAKLQRMEEEEPAAKLQRMEEEEPAAKLQRMEEEEPAAKLQRMEEEEPAAKLQRMEEEEPAAKLQRRANGEARAQAKSNGTGSSGGTGSSSDSMDQKIQYYKGKGMELPEDIKSEMESQFKVDFSNVRIHTGVYAHEMCEGIRAQAFTYGYDIYFNEGKFNPNSDEGKNLLAHELTHVVQQKGG